MIKNKIVQLESGIEYYVLEELLYNNKKYLLLAQCDTKKDDLKEENYIVSELKIENNELKISEIEDNNIAAIVTQKLLDKIKSESNK